MKRISLAALLICFSLLLCSCGGIYANYRDLDSLLVIQTMGLDTDGEKVSVSLASAGNDKAEHRTIGASAGSISSAMRRAELQSCEQNLFCTHINELLIGETTAEDGIYPFLEYICRSPDVRVDTPIYIIRDDSAENAVTDAGDGRRGIAELMQTLEKTARTLYGTTSAADIIREDAKYGSTLVCVLALVPASNSAGSESVKDSTDKSESDDTDGTAEAENPLSVSLSCLAVLRGGKLCRYLTEGESMAAGFIRNEAGIYDIELRCAGRTASVQIDHGESSVVPIFRDGELRGFSVRCRVSGNLSECADADAQFTDLLTAALEERVSQELRSVLEASKELKADFLRLATRVELSDNAYLESRGRTLPELLPELEFEVSVSASLRHTNDLLPENANYEI